MNRLSVDCSTSWPQVKKSCSFPAAWRLLVLFYCYLKAPGSLFLLLGGYWYSKGVSAAWRRWLHFSGCSEAARALCLLLEGCCCSFPASWRLLVLEGCFCCLKAPGSLFLLLGGCWYSKGVSASSRLLRLFSCCSFPAASALFLLLRLLLPLL